MADQLLRAGAAASNITPPLGVNINGGMSNRTASHIHDELHARALVLDNGTNKIAIVVCDSCMIPQSILNRAKHLAHGFTGIAPDQMLVSATHAHSAPAVAGVFQSEPEPEYAEFLAVRISDAIRRADNNLAPAKVGWGTGSEPTQVHNRRWKMKPSVKLVDPFGRPDHVQMNPPRASDDLVEPAGPTDPEIGVLSLRAADDSPLALLANYSLHYVGGVPGGHISADYFGAFALRVGQLLSADRLDPPFVGILSNGTSGNINNIDFRASGKSQEPYEQIRVVAELVAAEAARVAGSIEYHDRVPLTMREARLRLGRRPTPKDEVERARFILSKAKGPTLSGTAEVYARETVLLNEFPPVVETIVQAIRIGELGIAASPCETFVETGLAIKKESPLKPTFTIELANDYRGYLPTAEHHQLGGYETWRARSSFLEVDAEAKIRRKILELLREVAKA
jgi:Neutral/alkaline non-lysosomal ceramidase, N-terminal